MRPVSGFLNFALDHPGLDRHHRPAQAIDPGDQIFGAALDVVGQRFDGVRTGDRVDGVRDAGLGGDDLLGAQRESGRLLRRQRQRFVEAVAVERLRAAEDGGHGLERHPDEVVVRLLGGQRASGRLGVESQLLRARDWSRRSGRA